MNRAPTPGPPPSLRCASRAAYSLLEVVAAIALMGATLVPAMELIRDGMELSIEVDRRQLLALYAATEVENQLSATAALWANGTFSGDFAADGHADLRYTSVVSDDPLNGGVENQLMDIRTTTYFDENNNDALDADELSCDYRTKLGRFSTYEALSP